ncbi:MAG: peptide-methionine (R)-S-oxide reductase MsrB [Nitrospirales bacterium]|nr:peptide-methionine (R)-S-oxide reductase MsrB [Nitrospirales bacterium]
MAPKIQKSDDEWKQQLSPEQYYVTRQHGTEPAFTDQYDPGQKSGRYQCVCCGAMLFSTENKFNSGTGWPSFDQPLSEDALEKQTDASHGMSRVEVTCSTCDAHLGHVFDDGPPTTGQRYCINSVALKFEESHEA